MKLYETSPQCGEQKMPQNMPSASIVPVECPVSSTSIGDGLVLGLPHYVAKSQSGSEI